MNISTVSESTVRQGARSVKQPGYQHAMKVY